jgi:hypothetical protein
MSLKTKMTLLQNGIVEDYNITGITTGAALSLELLIEEFFITIFTF